MKIKIEISQVEALKFASALNFQIKATREATEEDEALIYNLRKIGGMILQSDSADED